MTLNVVGGYLKAKEGQIGDSAQIARFGCEGR